MVVNLGPGVWFLSLLRVFLSLLLLLLLLFLLPLSFFFHRERAEALGLEGQGCGCSWHLWSHTAIKRKLFLETGGCRAQALGKAQERKGEGGVGPQTQAGRERSSSLALGLRSFPGWRPGSTAVCEKGQSGRPAMAFPGSLQEPPGVGRPTLSARKLFYFPGGIEAFWAPRGPSQGHPGTAPKRDQSKRPHSLAVSGQWLPFCVSQNGCRGSSTLWADWSSGCLADLSRGL